MFGDFPQIWRMAPGSNMLPAGMGKVIGRPKEKRPMQRCAEVADGDDGERDGIQKVWAEYGFLGRRKLKC